jgi:selenocysteine-specific elongation factor
VLELLGIEHGIVALTMSGLVDREWIAAVREEVAERLAGTFLEGAPIVEVDAPTGLGITDLEQALDTLLAETPTATDAGRPRLWIDRSFTVRGVGHVVTGTLTGGSLAVGDQLEIVPTPHDRKVPVRVRGLHSHNLGFDHVAPGHRVAANISGIAHTEVERGQALIRPDQWFVTNLVDASLTVLGSLDHAVSRRGAYLAYFGSGEHAVKLRILGPTEIAPGESGHVRLHLPVRLPIVMGDRYVLRESGRSETVGGGEAIDVAPVRSAARARPDRSVERFVAERGWLDVDLLERMTGVRPDPEVGGRWLVDPPVLALARERVAATVVAAGPIGLDLAEFSEQDRAILLLLGEEVVIDGRRVRSASSLPASVVVAAHPYLDALADAPFSPPAPAEFGVTAAELRTMIDTGMVVKRGAVVFSADAVSRAAVVVAGLLEENPGGVPLTVIRQALGTTRKYAVPLLEHFDATGVTRRRGELRIAGPRLPSLP